MKGAGTFSNLFNTSRDFHWTLERFATSAWNAFSIDRDTNLTYKGTFQQIIIVGERVVESNLI